MVGATVIETNVDLDGDHAFSILYGSMVGATLILLWRGILESCFQYPLRIDGRCNVFAFSLAYSVTALSVSSTDRWSVQHADGRERDTGRCGFQYPLRIDGRCNADCTAPADQLPCLSVSSTDRWSVQLGCEWPHADFISLFQYPLRIDGRCNAHSVSSIHLQNITFSILYGSMVGATCRRRSEVHLRRPFSILYGSMVGATHFPTSVGPTGPVFQYPLRIDGRCNMLGHQVTLFGLVLSVSSTDRWSVQPQDRLDVAPRHHPFSILYGSMVGATSGDQDTLHGFLHLSVSSTDRWSVQPERVAAMRVSG